MGIDVSIYIRTDCQNIPAVFQRLLERLTPRFLEYSATLYTASWKNKQEIAVVDLAPQLPSLLANIVDSNQKVRISAGYHLASGAELIGFSLFCVGEAYEEGWSVRGYGALHARFEYNDIAPYWEPEGHQQAAPVAGHPAFPGHLLTDTEELFFRLAGLGGDHAPDPAIQQVVLELYEAVTAPVLGALVYQQNPARFVRDLATSYVRFKREILLSEQIFLTNDDWRVRSWVT